MIDFVITDHSPCTPALKLPERGDFQAAWGGIASLQLGLSAIWTEAAKAGRRSPTAFALDEQRACAFRGTGRAQGAPGRRPRAPTS